MPISEQTASAAMKPPWLKQGTHGQRNDSGPGALTAADFGYRSLRRLRFIDKVRGAAPSKLSSIIRKVTAFKWCWSAAPFDSCSVSGW